MWLGRPLRVVVYTHPTQREQGDSPVVSPVDLRLATDDGRIVVVDPRSGTGRPYRTVTDGWSAPATRFAFSVPTDALTPGSYELSVMIAEANGRLADRPDAEIIEVDNEIVVLDRTSYAVLRC